MRATTRLLQRPTQGGGGLPRVVGGLGAAVALIVTTVACGSDDGGLGGITRPADTPDDTPAAVQELLDELDELDIDLDADELQELAELLGEGDGSGELIIDGEPVPVRSVSCGRIPGGEQVRMEANIEPNFSYFQVRFSEDSSDPAGGYDYDRVNSAELWIDQQDFALSYTSFGGGAVVGWGDELHATGTAILTPSGERAETAGPAEQFVEFTIRCEPGHPVRSMPDGVEPLLPPGSEPDEADDVEPAQLFDPDDGWTDDLGAVDIPDEPGTGVAVVEGQRVELFVECRGGPRADEPVEGVAFDLDIAAADIVEGVIGFEISRTIGPIVRGTRMAIEEKVWVFRGGGVGALGWQVTPEGELVEPLNWPLATESFVRVDPSGAFSLELMVDHPLQGTFEPVEFELGGRCQDDWAD